MNTFWQMGRLGMLAVCGCALVGVRVALADDAKPDAPKAAAPKLVIVKAEYGDLPDGAKSDVTKKVAEMVKDGELSVDATNDNFGDPAEGVVKKLRVDYTFNGEKKSKTVDENQMLKISKTGGVTGTLA
jgi:hypothetical protein